MVRHFKTKSEAVKFRDEKRLKTSCLKVFKKLKGHKNRVSKPFVVCSEIQWINLY